MSYDLNAVFSAYIECALWSSVDDEGYPLDDWATADDIAAESLAEMEADVAAFVVDVGYLAERNGWTAEQFGHDFWLTRNDHGAGFWDRGRDHAGAGDKLTQAAHVYGSSDLYVGDDGKVYVT